MTENAINSVTANRFAEKAIVISSGLALFSGIVGLIIALDVPPDALQGNIFRLIFLHVPASWMSLLIYLAMAIFSGCALAYGSRRRTDISAVFHMLAAAFTPTGAMFTLLTLMTGAYWGKHAWGTWWVWWDPRLVSELILLFMYLGLIALRKLSDNPVRADKATALFSLVGVVNIPIVYFSVRWWNTLHQGYSITASKAPSMAPASFYGILFCFLACLMYGAAVSLMRFRNIILIHKNNPDLIIESTCNTSPKNLLGQAGIIVVIIACAFLFAETLSFRSFLNSSMELILTPMTAALLFIFLLEPLFLKMRRSQIITRIRTLY